MATIYASDGDTVVIARQDYEVKISEGKAYLTPVIPSCDACHKTERGVDFESPFGKLCGVCINTAMELYVAQRVINHLMENDEEIVEVIHIMERVDNDAKSKAHQHVDFHSSAIDYAWGLSEDDRMQFDMSLSASIRAVIDSRVLLDRA